MKKYNDFIKEGLWNNIKQKISDFTTSDIEKKFIKIEKDANNVKNIEESDNVKDELDSFVKYLHLGGEYLSADYAKKIVKILDILINKYEMDFMSEDEYNIKKYNL
jgi:hypothetical protein